MKFSKLFTLLLLTVGLAACSEQRREAGAEINDEELVSLYSEIMGAAPSGVSGTDTNVLQQLLEDPHSTIFHAGSSAKRPAVSVLSLNDFAFLDSVFQEEKHTSFDVDMQHADVIFIDGKLEDGDRRFGILMRMESYDGNVLYFTSTSESGGFRFTDSSFRVVMTGTNGESIILKSTDVSTKYSKELSSSIKLDVWMDDGSQEFYMGQISTMSSFGGH
jgi:hypothetical protein